MINWDPAADYLAESLRAAGATVEVSAPDPAEWIAQMRTEPGTWDVAVAAENAGSGLIHTSIARYLGPTYAEGGTNVVGADNPEGVAAYEEAMASADPDEQCAAFETAQKTILERVDMMPLITDTHRYVAREGFAAHVFSGYWDMSAMRIIGSDLPRAARTEHGRRLEMSTPRRRPLCPPVRAAQPQKATRTSPFRQAVRAPHPWPAPGADSCCAGPPASSSTWRCS